MKVVSLWRKIGNLHYLNNFTPQKILQIQAKQKAHQLRYVSVEQFITFNIIEGTHKQNNLRFLPLKDIILEYIQIWR